jgi:rubrerythrin
MKPLDTTPRQVLFEAIQSEVVSRVFLQKLAERAVDAATRKRILELADRETLHRAHLERRYQQVVGEAPPPPEPVDIQLAGELINVDLSRALKIALERERDSESNFRFLAERVPDTELGNLFLELAEIEWKHKVEIQREYDACMADDPEQFLLDI